MAKTSEALYAFCGFCDTGTTFPSRFIYNADLHSLTPCAEFAIVLVPHAIFLYYIVLAFFDVGKSSRVPSAWIRFTLVWKLANASVTPVFLLIATVLSTFFDYTLPAVCTIEYVFSTIIWLTYSVIWALSLHYNTWTRPLGLSVWYAIASTSFFMPLVQRWLVYSIHDVRTIPMFIIVSSQLLTLGLSFVEWRMTRRLNDWRRLAGDTHVDLSDEGDEGAGLFEKLFFCWANPLIRKGYTGQLNHVDDLFRLPPSLRVSRVEREFLESAPTPFTDAEAFSLAKALVQSFGLYYFPLGVVRLLADCFTFAGPVLLHLLITCLQEGDPHGYGYLYAGLMLVCSFSSAFCDFNFNFYVNKIALKVRCASLLAVYDKLLQIPSCRLSKFSSGQLINFMSADVDRIVNFCTSFHAFWSMPTNLVIALYLLYREVGLTFLSGLLAALLMVPLNKVIATKIGAMSQKMMTYKDQRMRLVTETMRSMRTVKLNNWEPFFEQRINEIRLKELKYLKARKYLDAVCVYLWASAPILITIAILSTYTLLLQEKLTAAKVFTSLALVNILILPLNAFPWVLNSMIEALVSKKRFDKFFELDNIDPHSLYALTDDPSKFLELEVASFSWTESKSSVRNLSFAGRKGTIVGIVGPVGSGKSTLLMGILGETERLTNSKVKIRQQTVQQGFAYVGQDCWLRRGTLRDNILCETSYQAHFYERVLKCTALEHDVQMMPGRDHYLIGDEGTTVSGGQRQRIALARAVYQDNDVYLLDEPFAALDRKVGRFIWDNCIVNMLKKRDKLVVVATHHVNYLKEADYVIVLNELGEVIKSGLPSDVLDEATEQFDIGTTAPTNSDVPFDAAEHVAPTEEEKEAGTVKISVYCSYLKATGYVLASLIFASLVAMQTSKNLSDAWLSKWTLTINGSDAVQVHDKWYPLGARPVELETNWDRTKFFLMVYVSMAAVNTVFTLARAFLFAYGGVVAAKDLHQRLLHRVFTSTMLWWDQSPWGRVLNRVGNDVYVTDDSLPFQLNICLASIVNLAGASILSLIALPFLAPILLILCAVYYGIQRYYRYTTCEVKRITSLTLSPLYSHITDTVTGLTTIRAFRFAERFTNVLREKLTKNLSAQYSSLAAGQWLSVRLQMLGVLMVSAIAFTAVVQTKFFYVETGLIGLAITYALSMTNLLNSLLSSFIETEKELVSVERIVDYIENIPEEETSSEVENMDRMLFCRTVSGQIDFTSVSLRYNKNLPWALKNVSFRIEPGQRVAIIGRTGSGKSSIFQALLRAHPIDTGNITIDGNINGARIDVKALRSIFGLVTQTPFIFSGSLRENLCLDRSITDDQIHTLLQSAELGPWLERMGGLDAEVSEGGSNFSFGEKQIICLCRLILSQPKIVLIDEATAHMDSRTHTQMNLLLGRALPGVTVISIVHRTAGLEHFDWIIEMSNGAVHRQGPPSSFQNLPQEPMESSTSASTC